MKDHLGSVRAVVNQSNGTVAQRIDYDAWGRVLADSSPGTTPFGFAGGLYDAETGLVRFGARDYLADMGAWSGKDPDLLAWGTWLYLYANGDPLNVRDATGRNPAVLVWELLALAAATTATAATTVVPHPTTAWPDLPPLPDAPIDGPLSPLGPIAGGAAQFGRFLCDELVGGGYRDPGGPVPPWRDRCFEIRQLCRDFCKNTYGPAGEEYPSCYAGCLIINDCFR